jgi:hypothetical protein
MRRDILKYLYQNNKEGEERMGIEDFYLKVKLQDDNMEEVEKIIKSNKVFSDYINHHIDNEDKELEMQAAKVCFFPACQIIFDLLKAVDVENHIEKVSSRRTDTAFSFESSVDFFCWMYKVWEDVLFWFHRDWGAFLINSANYYKVRNKMWKKYFIKYPPSD